MLNYIKGNYRKTIFINQETGYTIGVFKVIETNMEQMEIYVDRTITFTGYFTDLNEIDTYVFYGELINHERYGEQFKVDHYERVLPSETDAIVNFLVSGIFRGIGKKKAHKIVEVLGKDTLNIILNHPDNLLLIPGVSQKNIDILHKKLVEYQSSYQTLFNLSEMGFSAKDSFLIYHQYETYTMNVIDDNIYRLIDDIKDLTFKKIDYIALKKGILKNDMRRIMATIVYTMKELSNNTGHCYFYYDEIIMICNKILQCSIDLAQYQEAIDQLVIGNKIVLKGEDKTRYYLKELFEAENNIVKRCILLEKQEAISLKSLDKSLQIVEKKNHIKYNNDQKRAILGSVSQAISIISGGPGTGKTTIIQGIVELILINTKQSNTTLDDTIALLAPTGRASKRISEATGFKAQTIHRFLKWNKDTDHFAINEKNKSPVKWVIIDEVSMIDVYLLDNLFKGLSYQTRIIFIGDINQLPSVGPGQLLCDFIESNVLDVYYLNELYRQKHNSKILALAYHIKDQIIVPSDFNRQDDLLFIECSNINMKQELEKICRQYLDYDYKQFQVLSPLYKTQNGIDDLNSYLQEIFNPKHKDKKELIVGDVIYREGDKILQLTNMIEDNVYNGDIGKIIAIENENKKSITIDFDGIIVKYTPTNFSNFRHGFAISIHKAQGSEFDVVVMPILPNYGKMLYQRLCYTGVTRAKKKLFLLGNMNSLELAIKQNRQDNRRTTIKALLQDGIK